MRESEVVIQITEIIERDYVIDKGAEPSQGTQERLIRFKLGVNSQNTDVTKQNQALRTAIERKVAKNYATPDEEFWLVIFTTDVG